MGRIGDFQCLMPFFGIEGYRGIVVDRETYLSVVADDNDTVFFSRLMSYKTPRTAAWQSVMESEAGADRIFCLVESSSVAAVSLGFGDRSEHPLKQVQLMGSHIHEVPATGYIRLYSPWQVGGIVVHVSWRGRETYLYIDDTPYGTAVDDFLYFLEIGEISPVVSYETGNACLF